MLMRLNDIITDRQVNQPDCIFISSIQQVEKHEFFKRLPEVSDRNGLYGTFVNYHMDEFGDNPKAGIYFITAPDSKWLDHYVQSDDAISALIDEMEKCGNNRLCLLGGAYRITDPLLTKDTMFAKVAGICQNIQMTGASVVAMHECGLDLPKNYYNRYAKNLIDLNAKRHNPNVPQYVRDNENNSYKAFAKSTHDMMMEEWQLQDKGRHVFTDIFKKPWEAGHLVESDYFKNRNISTVTIGISNYFLEYIKKKIPKEKDFLYHIDKKPYIDLKDISKVNADKGDKNIWADDIAYQEYHFTYNAAQDHIVAKWMLEYCTRCEPCITTINDLKNTTKHHKLGCIMVQMDDKDNVLSLAKANGVKLAVDLDEQIRPLKREELYPMPMYYRLEDSDMVNAICNRLTNSRMNYFCNINNQQHCDAAFYKPEKEDNPFLLGGKGIENKDGAKAFITEEDRERAKNMEKARKLQESMTCPYLPQPQKADMAHPLRPPQPTNIPCIPKPPKDIRDIEL